MCTLYAGAYSGGREELMDWCCVGYKGCVSVRSMYLEGSMMGNLLLVAGGGTFVNRIAGNIRTISSGFLTMWPVMNNVDAGVVQ